MDREYGKIGEGWISRNLSFTAIRVLVTRLGTDYHIVIGGGEKPHIGCAVLAVPRPSLAGDGTMSCTSSVLNVTGHKDEVICRRMAELVAAGAGTTVACTGGVHMEQITAEQIGEVEEAIERLGAQILCNINAGNL